MEKIINISTVDIHARCPQCMTPVVKRQSRPSTDPNLDGDSLWQLSESCSVCNWSSTNLYVRIGA